MEKRCQVSFQRASSSHFNRHCLSLFSQISNTEIWSLLCIWSFWFPSHISQIISCSAVFICVWMCSIFKWLWEKLCTRTIVSRENIKKTRNTEKKTEILAANLVFCLFLQTLVTKRSSVGFSVLFISIAIYNSTKKWKMNCKLVYQYFVCTQLS